MTEAKAPAKPAVKIENELREGQRFDISNPLKADRVIYGQQGRPGIRPILIKRGTTARNVLLSNADAELHKGRENDLKLHAPGEGPPDAEPEPKAKENADGTITI